MVELLTVMSILVIILGVMAPSFSEFMAAQQAKGLSYDLTGDLMLARNEALDGYVRDVPPHGLQAYVPEKPHRTPMFEPGRELPDNWKPLW